MDGYYIQQLIKAANPGCTRCHGRMVVASSWTENQSPLGSGHYWPESFYEEDLCPVCCGVDESIRWLANCYEQAASEGDAFPLLHWNCLQCALDQARERATDADMEHLGVEEDVLNKLFEGLGIGAVYGSETEDWRATLLYAAMTRLGTAANKLAVQCVPRWEPVSFAGVRRYHLRAK